MLKRCCYLCEYFKIRCSYNTKALLCSKGRKLETEKDIYKYTDCKDFYYNQKLIDHPPVRKSKSKYKVGDKVRVKSLDWFRGNCRQCSGGTFSYKGIFFTPEMSAFCRKEVTISDVFFPYKEPVYKIKEDPDWLWYEWMFK